MDVLWLVVILDSGKISNTIFTHITNAAANFISQGVIIDTGLNALNTWNYDNLNETVALFNKQGTWTQGKTKFENSTNSSYNPLSQRNTTRLNPKFDDNYGFKDFNPSGLPLFR